MAKLRNKGEKVEDFKDALIKKALGFDVDEIVEEYCTDENGKPVLSKRKITKKYNPPDTTALKILLEQRDYNDAISKMTDKQLLKEKERLLQLLKEKENKNNENA